MFSWTRERLFGVKAVFSETILAMLRTKNISSAYKLYKYFSEALSVECFQMVLLPVLGKVTFKVMCHNMLLPKKSNYLHYFFMESNCYATFSHLG